MHKINLTAPQTGLKKVYYNEKLYIINYIVKFQYLILYFIFTAAQNSEVGI